MKRYDYLIDSLFEYKVRDNISESKWSDILSGKIKKYSEKSTYPNFLLTTLWGQSQANDWACIDAYNFFVSPTGNACIGCGSNNDNRCPTGCVATAMGQVMNYWKFADGDNYFGGSNDAFFDWWNMKNVINFRQDTIINPNYEKERDPIAHLLERCGDALGMNYCNKDCASSVPTKHIENNITRYNYSEHTDDLFSIQ